MKNKSNIYIIMFKIIQQNNTGVIQTLGKFSRLVESGISIYIPGIQTITPISNRLKQENFSFNTKTKDNVFVKLSLSIQYNIKSEDSAKALFSLENPIQQIDSYIENVVRVPKMNLDELYESHDEICNSVGEKLRNKMINFGYNIQNTLVTDILPDKKVKDAMNLVYATEKLKQSSKNEADADYIRKIRQAEADRDRKKLQGQGISQLRQAILQGYKTDIADIAKQLNISPQEIVHFVTKIQELDSMDSIGKSNNTKILFFEKDKYESRDNKKELLKVFQTMDNSIKQ
jgi:regulator of protease activity HflC (stomatin/prohibitin superfamily)